MAAKKVETTYATGRRKTSSARVFLSPKKETTAAVTVNGREMLEYFPRATTQMILRRPFEMTEKLDAFDMKITVKGGGTTGQAGAVVHGIARALEKFDSSLRPTLKKAGMLTRDSRVVERKKPGRHKARKKPQFSKR